MARLAVRLGSVLVLAELAADSLRATRTVRAARAAQTTSLPLVALAVLLEVPLAATVPSLQATTRWVLVVAEAALTLRALAVVAVTAAPAEAAAAVVALP